MSQVLESTAVPSPSIANRHSERSGANVHTLVWAALASLILIGSGAIRAYQTQHFQEEGTYQLVSPFPLKEIPHQLEGWHLIDGSTTVLDPLTTRITGSTDHIIGNYVNEQTGVIVTILALFGPAEPMTPHTPEVCYPSSGFKMVGGIVDRNIELGDRTTTRFRSDVFAKSGGRASIQELVYHSFRHDGVWVPTVNTKNSPLKNPAIYKVQVLRRMVPGEARGEDEPIEGFLKKMITELERMISNANRAVPRGGPAQASTSTKVAPTSPSQESIARWTGFAPSLNILREIES